MRQLAQMSTAVNLITLIIIAVATVPGTAATSALDPVDEIDGWMRQRMEPGAYSSELLLELQEQSTDPDSDRLLNAGFIYMDGHSVIGVNIDGVLRGAPDALVCVPESHGRAHPADEAYDPWFAVAGSMRTCPESQCAGLLSAPDLGSPRDSPRGRKLLEAGVPEGDIAFCVEPGTDSVDLSPPPPPMGMGMWGMMRARPTRAEAEFRVLKPSPLEYATALFAGSKRMYVGLGSADVEGWVAPINPAGKSGARMVRWEASCAAVAEGGTMGLLARTDVATDPREQIEAGSFEANAYIAARDHYDASMEAYVSGGGPGRVRTPLSLHWVWLGGAMKEMHAVAMLSAMRVLGEEWTYHLWTDRDVDVMLADPVVRLLEESGRKVRIRPVKPDGFTVLATPLFGLYRDTNNYGGMSDMIRMEVLFNEGGVYADVDYSLVQSLRTLAGLEFYAGGIGAAGQAPEKDRVWADVSIVAGRAGHPIFGGYLKYVRSVTPEGEAAAVADLASFGVRHNPGPPAPTKASMFHYARDLAWTSIDDATAHVRANPFEYTYNRRTDMMNFMASHTGPGALTREYFSYITSGGGDDDASESGFSRALAMVLPCGYMYPNSLIKQRVKSLHVVPEAFGYHHDTKSWNSIGRNSESRLKLMVKEVTGVVLQLPKPAPTNEPVLAVNKDVDPEAPLGPVRDRRVLFTDPSPPKNAEAQGLPQPASRAPGLRRLVIRDATPSPVEQMPATGHESDRPRFQNMGPSPPKAVAQDPSSRASTTLRVQDGKAYRWRQGPALGRFQIDSWSPVTSPETSPENSPVKRRTRFATKYGVMEESSASNDDGGEESSANGSTDPLEASVESVREPTKFKIFDSETDDSSSGDESADPGLDGSVNSSGSETLKSSYSSSDSEDESSGSSDGLDGLYNTKFGIGLRADLDRKRVPN